MSASGPYEMVRLLSIGVRLRIEAALMPLSEPGQINLVGHQCLPLGLGLGRGAEGAYGLKIIIYLQACPLRRLDDRIEEGRGVSTINCLCEQPVFSAHSKRAYCSFGAVVADFKTTVKQIRSRYLRCDSA